MTCKEPFELFDGRGCVSIYFKAKHGQEEGIAGCKELGGEIFEFDDYPTQYEPLTDYLIEKGNTSASKLSNIICTLFYCISIW